MDLVTPASKVAESLDGHANMGLEGQCVNSSGVNGFNGGQFLLVLLHKVSQPVGGREAESHSHYETIFMTSYRSQVKVVKAAVTYL